MKTLFIASGVTLVTSAGAGVVFAIIYHFIRPVLLKWQPRHRANALLGWAIAPFGVGLFFSSLLFIPSLLNHLGIPTGHCHNHAERLPHICLSNPLFSGIETLPWYLVLPLTALFVSFLASQAIHLYKVARLKAALHCAGCEGRVDYNLVFWKKPAALTVGFWNPQIYISRTLSQALSSDHFQVILAHEQGHVRHRDPLRQYLGRSLSILHLPWTRQRILGDLSLATEQACDEDAAQKMGSRLQVADTIVAVERLLLNSQRGLEAIGVGFANSSSTLRIEALLAEVNHKKNLFPCWILFYPTLALTNLVMPGPLHYMAELVVRH